MQDARHLPGGSGGVWRSDDPEHGAVVHRPAGAWSPAVHELLRLLAEAGLDGVPRVVAADAASETLTFLPGTTLDPDRDVAPDAALAGAAAWLRRYHDVVRHHDPGVRRWRQGAVGLAPGQIVCHNDTGLYNWVLDGDRFAGMIDWDQAGPGHPIDDLAFLCWTGVPLHREVPVAEARRRMRLAAEAYGGVSADELLDAVAGRMTRAVGRIRAGIERGDAGMRALRERGEPERTAARVDAFRIRLPGLR